MPSRLEHSAVLRIGASLSASFRSAVSGVSLATKRVQSSIAGLKQEQRGIATSLREAESAARSFGVTGSKAVNDLEQQQRALRSEQRAVSAELARAERAAVRTGQRGSQAIERLRHESVRLEREERDVAGALREARHEAERLGAEGSRDVARLRNEHERLERVLHREQRSLSRLKAFSALDVGGRVGRSLKGLGEELSTLTRSAVRGASVIGGLGVGAVALFTKSALESTAGIERMETALETLEGSQAAAKRSMDWIIDFSDRTPYELEQVGEAFTRLRAFGIDPTDGTLRTLGDTASSMGKNVMQAVEALTDAVTGETERLKEFGIRSATQGKKLTFFYKNALGKDVQKTVDKTSQTAIKTTLAAIWNEKYAGSMDKASRTWDGLMSTLRSKWTLFQVRVMRTGVFDTLKGQLSGLLDSINRWATDGTLDRWAKDIGAAYQSAFEGIGQGFQFVRTHWSEIKGGMRELWDMAKLAAPVVLALGKTVIAVGKWAIEAAGGPKNFAIGLMALGSLKVLAPLGGLLHVGYDVSRWLITSTSLSTTLAASMRGLGTAVIGLGPKLVGLQGALGTAGIWAAGIAGAGAFGYAAGRTLDELIGKVFHLKEGLASTALSVRAGDSDGFNRFVEGLGKLVGSDTLIEAARGNRQRNEIEQSVRRTSGRGDHQRKEIEKGHELNAARGTGTTIHDNRVIHVRVDAAKADANEVAEKVSRRLQDQMRREALSSHG